LQEFSNQPVDLAWMQLAGFFENFGGGTWHVRIVPRIATGAIESATQGSTR